MPYEFEYDVNDGDNQHGHRQQNDGRVTSGSYRVALPDGRTQIVTYRADHNGYNADVTYEESDHNPTRLTYRPPAPQSYNPPAPQSYYPPAPQSYYPPAPSSYYPPAPKPLIFRTPSYGSPSAFNVRPFGAPDYQPSPLPLIFRAPSYDSPVAAEAFGTTPFYTSPAVPPFGAEAIQDYDASFAPVPLLFRNNVAYKVTPHAEYKDRIPVEYRSAFGKRSLPIDQWNETSILEVLPGPAEVEAAVNVIDDVADTEEASATPAADVEAAEAAGELESSKAYANEALDDATLDDAELLPSPEAFAVEASEARTDSPSETYHSDVIEFDDLPFPLPLPLAFRPYAA